MKKILVILTGGTIGSAVHNGIINTDPDRLRVLTLYRQHFGTDDTFECIPLLRILSENLSKHHWELLVNDILSRDLSDYEGIIITHGSDTLSYTSAMLSLCLSGLSVPVILTAADYVPDDPRSNALCNLRAAVILIHSLSGGVLTVYRNPSDEYCSVFLSGRIREADRFSDRFSSYDGVPFGKIMQDKLILTHPSLTTDHITQQHPLLTNGQPLSLPYDVLMLRPYPSLPYGSITLSEKIRAVLHLTFHSSTAPSGQPESALTLLQECQRRSVPFYLASFSSNQKDRYESAACLLENGALPLFDIGDESAYAKVLLFCNLPSLHSTDFLSKNINWEHIFPV